MTKMTDMKTELKNRGVVRETRKTIGVILWDDDSPTECVLATDSPVTILGVRATSMSGALFYWEGFFKDQGFKVTKPFSNGPSKTGAQGQYAFRIENPHYSGTVYLARSYYTFDVNRLSDFLKNHKED